MSLHVQLCHVITDPSQKWPKIAPFENTTVFQV